MNPFTRFQIQVTGMADKSSFDEKIMQVAEQSAVFRRIGTYFEANREKLLYLSASEIAKNANVSQGSVSRFCAEMGYVGFAEFQKYLRQGCYEDFTSVKRVQNLRSTSNEIQELLEEEKANIEKLPSILETEDFSNIVDALVNSRKVLLISARISVTVLNILQYHLQRIRDNVVTVLPGDASWDVLEVNDPSDCFVLALSFPRYAVQLVSKVREMKEAGYKIGLLSDSILSPLVGTSTYHVELPIAKKSIFDSYSTPVLFVNILVMEVAKKIPGLEKRMEFYESVGKRDNLFIS